MSLAQRFERRLESLVGSAFARVFKGQVEPVEIGAALQREAADKRSVYMAEHGAAGSRDGDEVGGTVMCPNRYRVTLSTSDYERLEPWEAQLTSSLAELVQEHLDENRWTTIGDVEVLLALDESLHTGVFGVASRMEPGAPPRKRPYDSLSLPVAVGPAADYANQQGPPPPPPVYTQPPGQPERYYQPAPPSPVAAVPDVEQAPTQYAGQYADHYPPVSAPVALLVDGTSKRLDLRVGANLIGRGTEADLQLLDQGVSRRHAEVDFDGVHAICFDLGSTNGTTVNGHELGQQAVTLQHGDVIRVGHTRLVFAQEGQA